MAATPVQQLQPIRRQIDRFPLRTVDAHFQPHDSREKPLTTQTVVLLIAPKGEPHMPRLVVRIILLGAFVFSAFVALAVVMLMGLQEKETWAIIAALLAVLTSILSAWTAQTALELQEDEKLPNPLVSFDLTSRYGVIQLRVTNNGGGSAHEIRLTWNTPLKNQRGNDVRFQDNPKLADIPILQPHETISVFIDGSHQFFQRYKDSNFTGEIEFRNASGKTTKRPFYISAEHYRHTLDYDREELMTNKKLQEIPEAFQKLTSEVERLRQQIQDRNTLPPPFFPPGR
jgi:hypothetical protein